MSFIGIVFTVICGIALLALPRRWAPLPLLIGVCYMTYGQGLDIGPFRFTVIRLLIFAGILRVFVRRERIAGGVSGMDWIVIAWGIWAITSSAFHKDPLATLTFHLGMFYNELGMYFLIRTFCQSKNDFQRIVSMTAVLLVPLGLEMLSEQITHRNLFAVFGGVEETPLIRDGRLRSQGPFSISILAGTVGASCAPLMIGLWRKRPFLAKIGLVASLLMVFSSASSGPLMSVVFGAFALFLWPLRHLTRKIRIAALIGYLILDLLMKAPAYYLIARIDLTGSSSSWHRAELIHAALVHFSEWWLAGTDYTRHWMPTGVSWSEDNTDITNHYLGQGVRGGLPLMLLFISLMWKGFRNVGDSLRLMPDVAWEDRFLIWSLGASLFSQATAAFGLAYFDQSIVFLYLNLAATTSIRAAGLTRHLEQTAIAPDEESQTASGSQIISPTIPIYCKAFFLPPRSGSTDFRCLPVRAC